MNQMPGLAWLLTAMVSAAAPTVVQSAGLSVCSSTCSVTLGGPSTPGNTLVLFVYWSGGLAPLVDSVGDGFAPLGPPAAPSAGFYTGYTTQLLSSVVGDAGVLSLGFDLDGGLVGDAVLFEVAGFAGPGVAASWASAGQISLDVDSGFVQGRPGQLVVGYVNGNSAVGLTPPGFTDVSRFDFDLYVWSAPAAVEDLAVVTTLSAPAAWVAGLVAIDPSVDAGVDGGFDGGVDAGLDGGLTSSDGGSADAGVDAGRGGDAGLDAGLDAGNGLDAGGFGVPDAGGSSQFVVGCGCQSGVEALPLGALALWWRRRRARR